MTTIPKPKATTFHISRWLKLEYTPEREYKRYTQDLEQALANQHSQNQNNNSPSNSQDRVNAPLTDKQSGKLMKWGLGSIGIASLGTFLYTLWNWYSNSHYQYTKHPQQQRNQGLSMPSAGQVGDFADDATDILSDGADTVSDIGASLMSPVSSGVDALSHVL